jgi:hypothetical protein
MCDGWGTVDSIGSNKLSQEYNELDIIAPPNERRTSNGSTEDKNTGRWW